MVVVLLSGILLVSHQQQGCWWVCQGKGSDVASALPQEVQDFLVFQLTSIVNANRAGVSITLVVAIALALWSASGGMAALITGIHVAHEQDEPKSFVAKRGKALLLTFAAIVFLGVVVFVVAAMPPLLADLGKSVAALFDVLARDGAAERVLLLTFSEFGRRVAENASRGTDHGAAAPLFAVSGALEPGLVGGPPNLTDLDDGDVRFEIDFRRVYATVLERWLAVDSAPILGKAFEPLPFLRPWA